jgi:hypothetical protein
MATQAHEKGAKKASSPLSRIMTEFYAVDAIKHNDTRTIYFATKDLPTLTRVLQNPRTALGDFDLSTTRPATHLEVHGTQRFPEYAVYGLDANGVRELGELEVIVEKIPELKEDPLDGIF